MSTATKTLQTNNFKSSGNSVICRKCKSTQVIANKRGYRFGLMFIVLFSMVGIGLLLFFSSSLALSYSFSIFLGVIAAIGAFLFIFALPTALLCGFIGRNSLINGCMNCGNKWIAGKK